MALDDRVGSDRRIPRLGYAHHCFVCKRWFKTRMDSEMCINCHEKAKLPKIHLMTTQQAISGVSNADT